MQLDNTELRILQLAGKYRWLSYDTLRSLGFASQHGILNLLRKTGYLSLSNKKRYIKLAPQGYELLRKYGHDYDPGAKRASASSSALRRRLEVTSVMLTALRAGIDTLPDNVDALSGQPVFFPAFELRKGDSNLMNAASCVGFGHWGNSGYMLQYVSPDSCGMYLTNELGHLHNLASVFDPRLNAPLAMMFAGQSYTSLYEQLKATSPSPRHGKHGFSDYWDVYRKTDMPIHLLSCDEIGAMQLALMCRPEYNARIAKAALGDDWTPRDDQIPDADGCVGVKPLIIAADMDVRRVMRVCGAARSLGRSEVMVAAFEAQIKGFYAEILPRDGYITLLSIEQPVLDEAFGGGFSLYSMEG